jgi:hypothetical protein
MPRGWSLPAAILAVALLLLLLRGAHKDTITRASNSGKQEVVAIVNDERLRQLEAENAQLREQRNQAWQAETWLRAEKENLYDQIDIIAQRSRLLDQPVDADLLCLFNAAIELERGEKIRSCTAAPDLPTATDQPRWNDLETVAGYPGQ